MIFLNKTYPGLRMVMEPKKKSKDDENRMMPGKYIDFVDGKVTTTDPKEIKFIEAYMETHQNEIKMINEKDVERDKRIMKKAKELIEEEDRIAAEKGTADHDQHGKKIDKPEAETKKDEYGKDVPTDKEIEDAVIDDELALEDMTKVQLLKIAGKYELNINKRMKNAKIIKLIKKAEKRAASRDAANDEIPGDIPDDTAPEGAPGDVNLDDESDAGAGEGTKKK